MQRTERVLAIAKRLLDKPQHVVSLTELAEGLGAAKSSLSEDVAIVRHFLETTGAGTIESLAGAGGGIRYCVGVPPHERQAFLERVANTLSNASRLLPGGYVYMSDVLGQPDVLDSIGRIIASGYARTAPNVVVTVETKGIPIAVATARYLDVPVVIVRREHKVTEGPALSMHYVSGSLRRIETMYVSKRALPDQAKALIVDDFMQAGATVQGVSALLAEFNVAVVGSAVFVATEEPQVKLVSDYTALLLLQHHPERGEITLRPSLPGETTAR
ncbi:MAG: pur operon repressor [Alicyclobacillaceae bacterium]|jgi:purine operon repressor|uniref:pur operon repressor n=1 Tax=Alicyclobacillus sp. SP_1 TaxID=2942475 RepID=UPI0021584FAA|nr:pur operon repressor [Alicyclobacillus sp. SP_1]MCY0887836.1 pur operon repressor [Alicyclobacillaceae bacterium]MCY0896115.1 pur operon repressor [Alicyclobacillaceae bacterium]